MSRAMKNSGIPWIGEIPSHWSVSKVKHYFIRKNEKAHQDNPVILSLARSGVRVRDISNNEGQMAESYYDYNPVEVNDLLLNPMDLYSGANCSISTVKGVISPAYINLRFKNGAIPRYYDYYFKTQYWGMTLFAHGRGISFDNRWTLGVDTLFNYFIPVPPSKEQQAIASFLDKKCGEVDEMISLQERIIEELKAYKQSVITESVSKGLDHSSPMKDSGIDWIGDIPISWTLSSLGSISFGVRNGYVGPTRDLFVPDGVRYLQSLHIKDGKVLFDRHEYYVSEEWGKKHPKVHVGDILIVQTGDIGQVGLVEKEYDGCNCHALIILSPRTSLVFPLFLTYYLRSTLGRELLLQKKTGALLPHLNSGRIGSVPVILPSMEEQQAIALYLDNKCREIDALISVRQSKIAALKEYKKSIIYEYVTGKKEVNG